MAVQIVKLKVNDLEPPLAVTLTDKDGNRVDLDAASAVRFIMSRRGVAVVDRELTDDEIAPQGAGNEATWGDVEVRWEDGDTATRGDFSAEFEVMWPGDRPDTFPKDGYLRLRFVRDLG